MRNAISVGIFVAVLVCAGCGDSERPGLDDGAELGTVGTAKDEAGLREAVRAYLDAWSSGNKVIGCGLIAPKDARQFGLRLGDGTCEKAFENVRSRMSDSVRASYAETQIASVEIIGPLSDSPGAHVRLSARLDGGIIGDKLSWEYESGRWLASDPAKKRSY